MKKIILVVIGAALLFQCQAGNSGKTGGDSQDNPSLKGSMTISSTPDLYNIASKWASEYSSINPKLKIKVVSLMDAATGTMANAGKNLAFVSNDYNTEGSQWKMVVGRDVIVPVINSKNPFLNEIVRQGISAEDFSRIFKNPERRTWATLLEGGQNVPVDFYLIDNESIKSTIANFINQNTTSIDGIKVATGPEMVAAIQKDPNAIGFCKLSDIIDPSGQNLVSQISLLPIDKNGNGKMDYIEKIYDNLAGLSRGIWIGKYPKALCRNLYASSSVKPTNDNEIAFLKYVLTSGQPYLDQSGFNSLVNSERLSKIDRLPASFLKVQTSNGLNINQLIITILAVILFILAIMTFVIRYKRNTKPMIMNIDSLHLQAINENSLIIPKGLFFDKTHTWAFMEKDGSVRVGIDDFLQHVTGHITSIKMKRPGDKVKKGEPILTIIQKGKRLNISAPLSGIIRAENPILFTDSSLLNSSPYTEGWIYRIEPTNWLREIQFLLMAEKYSEWLKNEFSRLRDFLANAIKPSDPEYAYVILQDGGEISDHLLENLGPEVWEEFQTSFVDTSK